MELLTGQFNLWIVLLSFMIAIMASYSSLSITSKIWNAKKWGQFFWIGAGALVMGTGIWSMHFVGMLAFHIGMPMNYTVPRTLLSFFSSIIPAYLAFYLTSLKVINWAKLVLGGLIMGGGIAAMHYIGMSAMEMPDLIIRYDFFYTTLSVIIAVLASYAALLLFLRFRNKAAGEHGLKWVTAILMAVAVCGMHYVGMKASSFWVTGPVHHMNHEWTDMNIMLLIAVSLGVMIIMLITWGALAFDLNVLQRMAYTDPLTGLPNRHDMNRCFDDYLTGYRESAVFFLDLDQFKNINDTLGHEFGDLLVQEVAKRLTGLCSSDQKVFRLGGDEFLLLAGGMDRSRAEKLAVAILEEIRKPYLLEGNELYVTGSVGISLVPAHGTGKSELLKLADTAMYHAKSAGKNSYSVFDEELDRQLIRRMSLEKDLRRALEREEFMIHYQPKWNAQTELPVGMEALIRWNHPQLGLISPAEFIPIAEETGLIVSLTRWVMIQACKECLGLHINEAVEKSIPVSVNLSVRIFESGQLQTMVEEALSVTGLPAAMLELEITESIVMYDVHDVIQQLSRVRELGVQISMDDFGAGYSSLSSLDQLPIDTLKIDRQFIMESDKPSKRAIINTIIRLANELNLQLVAEGVEAESHIEFLREAGCNVMQGYYYSKPMNPVEMRKWFEAIGSPAHEQVAVTV